MGRRTDGRGAPPISTRSSSCYPPLRVGVIFAVHKVRLPQARSRATDRTVRPPVYIKVVQHACMSDLEPEQSVLVKVRRQPGDYRLATYRLDKVYRMRWDNVGGGIQQRSAIHVYGYVLCNELTCGKLAHSCRHGPPPTRSRCASPRSTTNRSGRAYLRSSGRSRSARVHENSR